MKKRLLSFVLVLALLVTCLAAVSMAAADGEKVNLTFLDISPREERKTYFTDVFARYNAEKDANVTIEYEEVPWADAYSKMVILGSSGDLPDLINMYPSWVSEFKMSDWIVPLDSYIEESGIMDTFVASMGPIMKEQADDNGGLYFIPDGLTTSCIYVRADWIKEKLGIDYIELLDDWTWERYIQLVYELTDPEQNRYGISFRGGFGGVDRVTEYLRAYREEPGVMWANLDIDNIDGIDYLYDTEEDVKLMTDFVSMYWDGCAPVDSINWGFVEMVDGFCGGLTGTLFNDMEVVASILASDLTEDQWGVLPVPAAKDGRIFQGVSGNSYCYSISNQTDYKDQVWDVITYLFEGNNNADYCKAMTLFPLSNSAADDPFFGEEGPMAGFLYEMNYPLLSKGQGNYGPADVTQTRLYDGTGELQKVLAKTITVEEFLKWFDDEITATTKEYLEDYPEAIENFGKVELYSEAE